MNKSSLETIILNAATAYYNGEAIMTDAEFDDIISQLRTLDPNSKALVKVGAPVRSKGKIKHKNIMGSLVKVFDTKWLETKGNVIAMPKYDGISTEIVYEKGIAIQASSRGDGEYGENLLEHVKKMKCYKLPIKFSGVLYGEMIMRLSIFEKKYSKDYANPRNLVAGISHRLDASGAEDCEIKFFDAPGEVYTALRDSGFVTGCVDIERKYIPTIEKDWKDFPMDGLVWEDLDTEERIAYKFPAEKKEVIVKEIEWNLSKVGNMIPVLIFNTVELAGTEVSRCTCNNASWIINRKIGIGSKIIVQKANEIIPNLVDVITKKTYVLPKVCPSCGYYLAYEGTHLVCKSRDCGDKKLQNLTTFFECIDMKEFGDAWFKHLYEVGFDDYEKVYKMKLEDYLDMGITEYSANKFIDKFKECWRKCSPVQFLKGLNITSVGAHTFQAIMDYYLLDKKTCFKIRDMSIEELQCIPRIGVIAKYIIDELPKKLIYKNNDLFSEYEEVKIMNSLNGQSFCFTGKLETMKRSEAEDLVKQMGGTIKSVSKGLTYLVTNDSESGSSKNIKAQELGVKVISEKEFSKIVEESK